MSSRSIEIISVLVQDGIFIDKRFVLCVTLFVLCVVHLFFHMFVCFCMLLVCFVCCLCISCAVSVFRVFVCFVCFFSSVYLIS